MNDNGWGLASDANTAGAVARTKPTAMIAPTRGEDTTELQVHVVWVTQTTDVQTGGTPILSYNLQWDEGTGNDVWVDLVGFPTDYLQTSYTVTEGVSKGIDYRFRLRSKNLYGFGAYSTIAVIRSSDVPDKPVEPSTAIDGTDVVITWTAPYENSEVLTEYDLQIRKGDGLTWLNDYVHCPKTPVTPTTCRVPMTTLRTDFALT